MAKAFHKSAGVVLYVVNGVARIRQLVCPNNPETDEQQAHRRGFRLGTYIAVAGLDLFINDLWRDVKISMSPYHSFMSVNGSHLLGDEDFQDVLMTVGEDEPVKEIISVKYKDAMGRIIFNWDGGVVGDGSPDDIMHLFAIDTTFWNESTGFRLLHIYINSEKIRKNRIGFIIPLDIAECRFIKGYISASSPAGVSPRKMSVSKFKQCTDF